VPSPVTDQELRELFGRIRTIAVVGMSHRPERPSHEVPAYLREHGYRIIPVNPGHREILGETCYPNLAAVPEVPDVVLVFRRSEDVPPVADAAVAKGAKVLWLQLGITHPEAEAMARAAGLFVVSDRCMMVEHRRLFGTEPTLWVAPSPAE